MRTADFDYDLPPELIAAYPAERRDGSRLLVLNRQTGEISHRQFADLPEFIGQGDCLALNDTKVIPARIRGVRDGGGKAEVLLLESESAATSDNRWRAMVRPAKKLGPGAKVWIESEGAEEKKHWIEIEEALEGSERRVHLNFGADAEKVLAQLGEVPLPPYILAARSEPKEEASDRKRYQTVYARNPGSVAAPTAGLHFTPEMLKGLEREGTEVRRVTLHVGPGTFAPVRAEDPREHAMHTERFEVAAEDAPGLATAIQDPTRRVVAVGTTVTRVLESCMAAHGTIPATRADTDLMIVPGYSFLAIDALLTNFHLPRSTLLMLVSAFAGRENVLVAYREAIEKGYRFYSYGDAMLIC